MQEMQQEAQALHATAGGNALASTLAQINGCTNQDDLDLIVDGIRFIDNQQWQAQLLVVAKQHRVTLEQSVN